MSDFRDETQGRPLDATEYRIEEDFDEPPTLCFCGRELPGAEQGDFCSQACRSQALEET